MAFLHTALLREASYRRCASNELYFFEKFIKIRHPDRGRIPFTLRPAQKEILSVWNGERYSISLKARQIGYSTLAASHSLWLALFRPDTHVVMLSKGQRESVKLLEKSKYAYQNLPEWFRDRATKLTNRHQQEMKFANGSFLESLPSKEDPARGSSVYLVIVDEWAFLENPEEAWASIEPVADVGGRVIGLSTANGAGTFFHQLYSAAAAGNSMFKAMFFPWSANPDRDEAWYEGKKKEMVTKPWQLWQEYPSNDVEAFVKSGHAVFDYDMLAAQKAEDPLLAHVMPDRGSFRHPRIEIVEDEGPVSIWERPLEYEKYVIGADPAQGLEHGDYSCAHVIAIQSCKVVATYHGKIDGDLFGEQLFMLGSWYNGALVGIEVTGGFGGAPIGRLQRLGYGQIYMRHTLNQRTMKQQDTLGWSTTPATKELMIDELNRELREGTLTVPCAYTVQELRQFIRNEKGKMHGSPHDDRVMALAVANQMRKHAFAPTYKIDHAPPPGSFDAIVQGLLADDRKAVKDPIGGHSVRNSIG